MEEDLTKVHVDLPNHWAVGGEAMWARALGNNRFQIENVPFYAYDLNYGDIVEAIAKAPDLKPSVIRVLERSGHQTIRVLFEADVPEDERLRRLHSLEEFNVSFERANQSYFALDLEPDADIDVVRDRLDAWHSEGIADYETCEARIAGSFDADHDSEERSNP